MYSLLMAFTWLQLDWLLLGIVLLEGLFDGNSLELRLTLGFLVFNMFMVREMLEIFLVDVRLVCLGLWRTVELLWGGCQ